MNILPAAKDIALSPFCYMLNGNRTKRQMIAIHVAAQVKVESKGTGLEGSEGGRPFIYAYLKKVAVITFFVNCNHVLIGIACFSHIV